MSIRIHKESSQILVVDIQTALAPYLQNVDEMVRRATQLLSGAQLFDIPITVAEQYPQGLGPSVTAIKPFIQDNRFEKTTFSCFGSPEITARLANFNAAGRDTLIVLGCEAHVCVLQTVIDALDCAYRVVVVADAVSSRNVQDKDVAQTRLSRAGAEYVTTEMLLFEWTQGKGAKQFKDISALVK